MHSERITDSVGARNGATDWLLLAVPGVIWGASFLFIAEGLRSIGPNGITFCRILVGLVTLSCFSSARKPVRRSDWVGIAAIGILWMAFPLSMFPYAEQHVSSALTGMLNGANPLFTAVVAVLIARSLPSRGVMTSVAVGIAGAVLIALPSLGQGHSSAMGVGMIFAALVSYGFALNIVRPLQQRNGALAVIWRAQALAVILTAPLGVPELLHANWSFGPAFCVLALGMLGTGVAYVVMSIAAGRMGATQASTTTFFIPGVALALGLIVRHESVSLVSILGSVICVAGAWLMRRAQAHPIVKPSHPESVSLVASNCEQ
jgi:drug/metabolite transporter (DMT)-like permease